MLVAVTGSEGFLGRQLVAAFRDVGVQCRTMDVEPSHDPHHICGDVRSAADTARVCDGVDVVIHCAGPLIVNTHRDVLRAQTVQLQGTLAVIEAARFTRAAVVLISSVSVYDGYDANDAVDEDSPLVLSRTSDFGALKIVAEDLVTRAARYDRLDAAIVRLGSMYGSTGGTNAAAEFWRDAQLGRDILVWGSGARISQPTLVEDVARCLVQWRGLLGGCWNLVASERLDTLTIATAIAERWGVQVRLEPNHHEPKSLPYVSASRATNELGWRPRSILSWIREAGH
jgi:nucleoside-diphosphate-sugar epimerase